MKRNLNENAEFEYDDSIKICVSEIREDDPELDCNKLRDLFVEEGAHVEGEHGLYNGKHATFMIVTNLLEDDVISILNEFLSESEYVDTAEKYIISDNVETDYVVEPENSEFPAYEDVDLDPEEDALNDDALFEGDNVLDDAKDELRSVLAQVEDEIYLSDEGIVLDTVLSDDNLVVYSINANGDMETDEEDIVNAFDLTDADDIFTLCDVIKDALDFDEQYPEYDDVDIDDEDNGPRFEKMKKHGRLDEKKKNDCCPGTGKINESENNAVNLVLEDINTKSLNESKEETNKKEKSLEVKAAKALSENRHSLYNNISYNGKTFDKMTLSELKKIYETVSLTLEQLNEKSLNESVVSQSMIDTINNKKKLLEYLDNEITYRTVREKCIKKLNEDGAEISDEELANLFGPAQGENEPTDNSNITSDNNSTENTEDSNSDNNNSDDSNSDDNSEDEEVELSRVVITLKDAQAANDLKQACLDADIPEDAFELENVDEEDTAEDENSSDENTEDNNSDENSSEENSDNTSDENANESYEYAKYVKLLMEGEFGGDEQQNDSQDQNTDEQPSDDENTDNEDNQENSEDSENEDDKQPKFILTNTDYVSKLAQILNDVYGISKEEFEDMIGGSVVEEDSDDSENSDNNDSENSDNNSDNSEDNSEEEIDPSDLFKNL